MTTLLIAAGLCLAAHGHVTLDAYPVACKEATTVEGRAPSLLPEGKSFKLVWHDEFDGTTLDESKWSYRTNFWGRNAHWFAKPEDGCVEVKGGVVKLKVKKLPNGQFVSPQLQTGELGRHVGEDADLVSFSLERLHPARQRTCFGRGRGWQGAFG